MCRTDLQKLKLFGSQLPTARWGKLAWDQNILENTIFIQQLVGAIQLHNGKLARLLWELGIQAQNRSLRAPEPNDHVTDFEMFC